LVIAGVLWGGQVVADQVHVQLGRNFAVDLGQELALVEPARLSAEGQCDDEL
jgi:hypothetical protein